MEEREEEKEGEEGEDRKRIRGGKGRTSVKGRGKPGKMHQGQKVMSTSMCTLTHLHWFHTRGSWPPVLFWHCS